MGIPVKQVAEGIYNNLTNKEEELYNQRIEICRKCKLITKDAIFGEKCNSNLYLNPITDNISLVPKEGFYRGCGCILNLKCRVPQAQCPIKK